MRKTYILISLCAVAGIIVIFWLNINNKSTQPVACTTEAKLCPDGSAVSRMGPNCEFAPCPDVVTPPHPGTAGDIVLNVRQKGSVGDLDITVNTLVQDSRCPIDVQCIWAGVLKVNVTFASGSKSETRDMSLGEEPYLFDGHNISIVSVTPMPKSTKKITAEEYRISFHVVVKAVPDTKKDFESTGMIKGSVTLSPICPVERIPPDPKCAPKPYKTKVEVYSSDSGKLLKSTQTGSDGSFSVALPFGNYKIQAGESTIHPSCSPIDISVQTATTSIDISCDTGIR